MTWDGMGVVKVGLRRFSFGMAIFVTWQKKLVTVTGKRKYFLNLRGKLEKRCANLEAFPHGVLGLYI